MSWVYQGKPFLQEDVPDDMVGFVYVITNNITQRKYVGKKLFWSTLTRPPLKGKKRKRKSIVPSDWQKYCSSSEQVKEQIKTHGLDSFTREILDFADSKAMLSYKEAELQFKLNVLFDDTYLNGIINLRVNANQFRRTK